MYFSSKRQQYLVDQGYTFKVIKDIDEIVKTQQGLSMETITREKEVSEIIQLTFVSATMTVCFIG